MVAKQILKREEKDKDLMVSELSTSGCLKILQRVFFNEVVSVKKTTVDGSMSW